MLVTSVIFSTLLFCVYLNTKRGAFPSLQEVILITLGIIATLQNIKFFYIIFAPNFASLPLVGQTLSTGGGIIQLPANLSTCLESVGSEFDRFSLGLGPLAVIWLSIKQLLELAPKKQLNKKARAAASSPRQTNP